MTARDMTVAIAAILLVAHSAERCLSQEPGSTPNPIEQAMVKAGEGKLLAAVALLEAATGKKGDDQGALGAFRSFVGDWRGAHEASTNYYPKQPKDAVAFSQPVNPFSALDVIADQAKNHRIVIVNEAHHVPQHRAFILARKRGHSRMASN